MYHEDAASSFDPNSLADDGFAQTALTTDCPVLPLPPPLVPANTTEDQNNIQLSNFATERQRRQRLNDTYKALRSLIPNPTQADRASVVGDAIKYIKELLRTMTLLKILVEKKRCGRESSKRHKTTTATDQADTIINATAAAAGGEMDIESCSINKPLGFGGAGADADQSSYANNGSLRSSWLQRKSKDTEVDVRIVENEVNIKLVQRKKINCLLYVSKTLDELHLDLQHVTGGHTGDHYTFLLNTKIYEGSSVYASAIANKLIEGVDRQYSGPARPTQVIKANL
ncbi:transcription factor bHLH10-like [Malania oleifera]|uniref:transcription factor bHLH10-like n=1 Tax=Malania oleifera TaxID=397392 RepID=UPI0025AE897F|nr:transcription factor bHLH10-like [Malania oleifera]